MQPEQFKQMLEKLEEIRCGLIDIETAVEKQPEANEPGGTGFQCSDLVRALRDVTEYAARNCCLHEETHRGGFLWEICDYCGCKWADDEGGMPPEARECPPEIKKAFAVLGKYSHKDKTM